MGSDRERSDAGSRLIDIDDHIFRLSVVRHAKIEKRAGSREGKLRIADGMHHSKRDATKNRFLPVSIFGSAHKQGLFAVA